MVEEEKEEEEEYEDEDDRGEMVLVKFRKKWK